MVHSKIHVLLDSECWVIVVRKFCFAGFRKDVRFSPEDIVGAPDLMMRDTMRKDTVIEQEKRQLADLVPTRTLLQLSPLSVLCIPYSLVFESELIKLG